MTPRKACGGEASPGESWADAWLGASLASPAKPEERSPQTIAVHRGAGIKSWAGSERDSRFGGLRGQLLAAEMRPSRQRRVRALRAAARLRRRSDASIAARGVLRLQGPARHAGAGLVKRPAPPRAWPPIATAAEQMLTRRADRGGNTGRGGRRRGLATAREAQQVRLAATRGVKYAHTICGRELWEPPPASPLLCAGLLATSMPARSRKNKQATVVGEGTARSKH